MLAAAAQKGRLVINPLIYSEVSCGFDRIELLDEAVPPEYFVREALPWSAAFLAGKVFLKYRRSGGSRAQQPEPGGGVGQVTLQLSGRDRDLRIHVVPEADVVRDRAGQHPGQLTDVADLVRPQEQLRLGDGLAVPQRD